MLSSTIPSSSSVQDPMPVCREGGIQADTRRMMELVSEWTLGVRSRIQFWSVPTQKKMTLRAPTKVERVMRPWRLLVREAMEHELTKSIFAVDLLSQ
jgi:hypothetical protein